ncbi:VOC family protein [Sphingomonas sp.]|uniref:VOC family protein n=1 Tax=Sphingomonas sp. TaxID=28214 RepID=UPI003B3A0377
MSERNPHGWPIWYELVTADAEAAAAFYQPIFGWSIGPKPAGDVDYRMIDTGHGHVGGLLSLTDTMAGACAKPGWLFYVGVDDVDAAAATAADLGGTILKAPRDLPDVGRFALVADPQGVPFYVMRGAVEGASTAYDRMGMGKGSWNELATPDQPAANAFYAALFGWDFPDRMPMGEMGDYIFLAAAGQIIGATMPRQPGGPAGWQFYFRVPDIDAAAEQVRAGGGAVHFGPQEVPGGERVIVASDPHGVMFGAVAPAGGKA